MPEAYTYDAGTNDLLLLAARFNEPVVCQVAQEYREAPFQN